jgi:hypothetical protein
MIRGLATGATAASDMTQIACGPQRGCGEGAWADARAAPHGGAIEAPGATRDAGESWTTGEDAGLQRSFDDGVGHCPAIAELLPGRGWRSFKAHALECLGKEQRLRLTSTC